MNNQQYDVYNGGGCGFNSNQSIADVVGKNSFEPLSSFSSSSSQINMKSNLDQFGSDFFPNDFYSTQILVIVENKRKDFFQFQIIFDIKSSLRPVY